MIMVPSGAAHRAWVADYKLRGPALTQYAAYCRGFNEGAASAIEAYLKVSPEVPKVPTVDTVRAAFCEQVNWRPLDRVKKFLGLL